MPKYAYKAWDGLGRLETGVLEADSERAAVASFQSRGFLVTSLTTRDEKDKERPRRLGGYFRVNRKDLVVVTRQLSTMVAAGLPIISALRILGEQVTNRRLRQVIARVRQGIERGGSLSDEIAKYPEAFFPFYVNTIRAGEGRGCHPGQRDRPADHGYRGAEDTDRGAAGLEAGVVPFRPCHGRAHPQRRPDARGAGRRVWGPGESCCGRCCPCGARADAARGIHVAVAPAKPSHPPNGRADGAGRGRKRNRGCDLRQSGRVLRARSGQYGEAFCLDRGTYPHRRRWRPGRPSSAGSADADLDPDR